MYLPREIEECLKERFNFPEGVLAAQVATSPPNIRTMRIFDFDKKGRPVLFSHTHAQKWQEWRGDPTIALCLVASDWLTQITLRGTVELLTKETLPEQIETYWNMTRPDIKKIYLDGYQNHGEYCEQEDLIVPENAPDRFGIVRVTPTFWELLDLSVDDYLKSHRYNFSLVNGQWAKKRINVG